MAEGGQPKHRHLKDECADGDETSAPSNNELLDLSLELVHSWKRVGMRLGLNKNVLEDIDANNVQYPSPIKKALTMLMEWHNRMPDSFSYMALSKALIREGLFELERKYCGCQESAAGYHGRQEKDYAPAASQGKSQARVGRTTHQNLSGPSANFLGPSQLIEGSSESGACNYGYVPTHLSGPPFNLPATSQLHEGFPYAQPYDHGRSHLSGLATSQFYERFSHPGQYNYQGPTHLFGTAHNLQQQWHGSLSYTREHHSQMPYGLTGLSQSSLTTPLSQDFPCIYSTSQPVFSEPNLATSVTLPSEQVTFPAAVQSARLSGHPDVFTSQPTSSPGDPLVKEAAGCQDVPLSQPATSPEDTLVTKEVESLLHNMREEYKKREAFLHPIPWCEDFQLSLNTIYTEVRMVTRKKERSELTEKKCSLYEVFQPHQECGNPRVVLLEGKPGMGKTVSCQKVTFDWSMGETNGFLNDVKVWLKIKCRDLKNADIKEAIIEELLPLDLSQEVKTAFFNHIKSSESGVLLVLDGLDELKKDIDLFPLIKGKLFPRCRLLLTSRNNPRLRQHCDTLFQIIGFTREHAKAFIAKYFRNNEEKSKILLDRIESLDDEKSEDEEESEDDEGIIDGAYFEELLSSPLNTALLCAVVEDIGRLPSRATELYQELTGCLLRRHYKKKGQEPPVDPIATHEEDLAALGRLALEGIKNDRLHFNQDDFDTEDRAARILDYGFVSKQSSASIVKPRLSYEFIHKTLQEFFAAQCLQSQLLSGNEACLGYLSEATGDKFGHFYKFKQIAIFLFGLMTQKSEAGKICVRLVRSLTQNISNTDYRSSFLYICDVIRENVSVDLEEDLHSAVVSSFTWEDLGLSLERLDENSVEYRLVCQVLERNGPLEWLHLGNNEIKDISMLGKCIVRNSTLQVLYLDHNPLLHTGVRAFAKNLQSNKTLKVLGLGKKWENEPAIQELERHNTHLDIRYPLF